MTDSNVLAAETHFSAANDQHQGGGQAPSGVAAAATLHAISGDALKEILQAAGYRVDVLLGQGITVLRSATGGLGFEVRLINPVAGGDSFVDMTFVTHFAVEGTFPVDLLNQWNKSRRFARLFLDRPESEGEFLVLALDLSFAGGVSADHVRAHIAIWDTLVHQLVAWLREELPKVKPTVSEPRGELVGA
jgi:hypothetical protein